MALQSSPWITPAKVLQPRQRVPSWYDAKSLRIPCEPKARPSRSRLVHRAPALVLAQHLGQNLRFKGSPLGRIAAFKIATRNFANTLGLPVDQVTGLIAKRFAAPEDANTNANGQGRQTQ